MFAETAMQKEISAASGFGTLRRPLYTVYDMEGKVRRSEMVTKPVEYPAAIAVDSNSGMIFITSYKLGASGYAEYTEPCYGQLYTEGGMYISHQCARSDIACNGACDFLYSSGDVVIVAHGYHKHIGAVGCHIAVFDSNIIWVVDATTLEIKSSIVPPAGTGKFGIVGAGSGRKQWQ